jgi:hypothetical protein
MKLVKIKVIVTNINHYSSNEPIQEKEWFNKFIPKN